MSKTEKSFLRQQMLKKRSALNWLQVQGKSHEMTQYLFLLPQFVQANTVLVYLPIKNEVDTFPIIKTIWQQNKQVVIPICQPDNKLLLSHFNNIDDLTEGTFGIMEVKEDCLDPVPSSSVEIVLVPGLAFDKSGHRLGYGKGYYDRFLKTLPPKTPKVALAFDFQFLEKLPAEEHDVPLDIIVTNEGIHYVDKGN